MMSEEYYEGMRQVIIWRTMWTCVIPFSIVVGFGAGLLAWLMQKR